MLGWTRSLVVIEAFKLSWKGGDMLLVAEIQDRSYKKNNLQLITTGFCLSS